MIVFGGQVAYQLQLVRFVGEEDLGLLLGHLTTLERSPAATRLSISATSLGRSSSPTGLRKVEVVIEAILDGGADGDLGTRVEPGGGLGQDVRGRVPDHVETLGG